MAVELDHSRWKKGKSSVVPVQIGVAGDLMTRIESCLMELVAEAVAVVFLRTL